MCGCKKSRVWEVSFPGEKKKTERYTADVCMVKPDGLLFFDKSCGCQSYPTMSGLNLTKCFAPGFWRSVEEVG